MLLCNRLDRILVERCCFQATYGLSLCGPATDLASQVSDLGRVIPLSTLLLRTTLRKTGYQNMDGKRELSLQRSLCFADAEKAAMSSRPAKSCDGNVCALFQ